MPPKCPLCSTDKRVKNVRGADKRRYFLCDVCRLIYADPTHFLSPEDEKARYATHRNGVEHEGYVAFLYRLLQPMLPLLNVRMRGLDYGSGPGPTLSVLARRHGIACEDYDPFFANRPLRPPYDFIFSSECFEHFHHPAKEFQRICELLKPDGLLGVMTERWTTLAAFAEWYYTKDPTHVSFYHAKTFDFACNRFSLKSVWRDDKSVVILRRHNATT